MAAALYKSATVTGNFVSVDLLSPVLIAVMLLDQFTDSLLQCVEP